MPPAARVTDNHICPMFDGPKPHVGGPILPAGCPTVLIGGLPAARVGDMATCVGPPDVIVMGSPTVLIGCQPAARIGDNTAHGGVIVVGHPTVLIGIPGQGDCLTKAAEVGAPVVQKIPQRGDNQTPPQAVASFIPDSDNPPDKVYDGMYVGKGGAAYTSSTPLSSVPPFTPSNGRPPQGTIIYVNGILTDKATQAASLQKIADKTGASVIGVHNATAGVARDLSQCVTDKANVGHNPAVDTMADAIYGELTADPPHSVHVMAHSQGGLVTSRAIRQVKKRLRIEDGLSKKEAEQRLSGLQVETFGAAAGHYPDGPRYKHVINRYDLVPTMTGLGIDADDYNPTLHAGRDASGNAAEVVRFSEPHLNPIAAHSFDDVYLPRRTLPAQASDAD